MLADGCLPRVAETARGWGQTHAGTPGLQACDVGICQPYGQARVTTGREAASVFRDDPVAGVQQAEWWTT
jgi:hypothetical protein